MRTPSAAAAGARVLATFLAYSSITAFLARASLRALRPERLSVAIRPSAASVLRCCHVAAPPHSLRRTAGFPFSITFIWLSLLCLHHKTIGNLKSSNYEVY
jgi:hypothetical protein